MLRIISVFAVCFLVLGCASSQRIAETQSGLPEIDIATTDKPLVKELIVSRNASKGWLLESESGSSLLFSVTDTSGSFSAALTQVLIGNSYSTPPKYEANYIITTIGNRTKVIVNLSVSTQMAFGQIKKYPLNNNNDVFNAVQGQLIKIKQEIESTSGSGNAVITEPSQKPATPLATKYSYAAESASFKHGCSRALKAESVEAFKEIYSAQCAEGKKIFIVCGGSSCAVQ